MAAHDLALAAELTRLQARLAAAERVCGLAIDALNAVRDIPSHEGFCEVPVFACCDYPKTSDGQHADNCKKVAALAAWREIAKEAPDAD